MALTTALSGVLGANVFGGGLANAISGSNSFSGSQNSAYSSGGSSQGAQSSQNAWSNTAGIQASANSAQQAQIANDTQMDMLKAAQEFNAMEAQKQRDWQEQMANTVYTRSVKNMIEAGINPILAANLGLSAGNVASGASASVGTPSAFMGQSFAEQNSASGASSSEWGSSWNSSQSHGEEWSNSHSGLAEGLKQLGAISDAAMNEIQSSEALKFAMKNFGDGRNFATETAKDAKDAVENIIDDAAKKGLLGGMLVGPKMY